jgi:hypothetical protein
MARHTLLFTVLIATAFGRPAPAPAQELEQGGVASRRIFMPGPRPPRPPGDGWVWIPPTYRTVYERVWQEPVYRTVTEQVWVPDEYGWRTVDCLENGVIVRRQVWTLIRPGRFETQTRTVLVSPGGWVDRARRELVTPGHWEWRGPVPPPPPVPLPQPWPQPIPPRPAPSPRPPALEPFSPLWEWPDEKR